MRVLFSSDLHGDLVLYQALLALAAECLADVVIVGGDLLPHTSRRDDAITLQRRFLDAQIAPLLEQTRRDLPGLTVYLLPGNDDWLAATQGIDDLERAGLVRGLHGRVWPLDEGLWLAGYACVPLTPFSIKDFERRDEGPLPAGYSFDMAYVSDSGIIQPITAAAFASRPSIADDMAWLATRSDPARTMYVCHTPPFHTALDQMRGNRHIGSRALRAFIERYQPPATLHGHIHEAPRLSGRYTERLGATRIIAAGREGSRLHAVTFDTAAIEATLWHSVYGRNE